MPDQILSPRGRIIVFDSNAQIIPAGIFIGLYICLWVTIWTKSAKSVHKGRNWYYWALSLFLFLRIWTMALHIWMDLNFDIALSTAIGALVPIGFIVIFLIPVSLLKRHLYDSNFIKYTATDEQRRPLIWIELTQWFFYLLGGLVLIFAVVVACPIGFDSALALQKAEAALSGVVVYSMFVATILIHFAVSPRVDGTWFLVVVNGLLVIPASYRLALSQTQDEFGDSSLANNEVYFWVLFVTFEFLVALAHLCVDLQTMFPSLQTQADEENTIPLSPPAQPSRSDTTQTPTPMQEHPEVVINNLLQPNRAPPPIPFEREPKVQGPNSSFSALTTPRLGGTHSSDDDAAMREESERLREYERVTREERRASPTETAPPPQYDVVAKS